MVWGYYRIDRGDYTIEEYVGAETTVHRIEEYRGVVNTMGGF